MKAKKIRRTLEDRTTGADCDAAEHFTSDEIAAVFKELALHHERSEHMLPKWNPIVESLRASAPPLPRNTVVPVDPASLLAFETAHETRCSRMLQANDSVELMQARILPSNIRMSGAFARGQCKRGARIATKATGVIRLPL